MPLRPARPLGRAPRCGSACPSACARAGLEARYRSPAVLLAKLAGAASAALAALAAAPAAPGRLALLVAVGLPAAGFFAPDALLEREARRRRRRLLGALPDALDLLAVSAASGRGPAAGLRASWPRRATGRWPRSCG